MAGLGSDGFTELRGTGGIHPNPMFDFLSGYVPKNLKALLVWSEYLVFNSPHIYAALQKLSEYTITDITYNTEDESVSDRHKRLLEKTLNIRPLLKVVARDRQIYGNSFVTVYFPFTRTLKCSGCSQSYNIEHIEYKFELNKLLFKWACRNCKTNNSTHLDAVQDKKLPDPERINVIRWDPKAITINYNPITGEKAYAYEVPESVRNKIKAGSKFYLNSMPKEYIKAAKGNKVFNFKKGKIFHLKVDAPAGIDSAWGLPPLTATLKQFFYTAVLRKANEAVAMDHIVPFRVLHPGQGTANADPIVGLGMSRWVEETKKNIEKWRRDPLHIMFSSVPLGVTQMGGQGRSLLTLGEIEAAENNIMAALGIPKEFLYGGLSFAGSSVTLRMLENQLMALTTELTDLLDWIGAACAKFLAWDVIDYGMVPFKLVDDVQQKQVMLQLASEQVLSKTTLADTLGFDIEDERDKRMQETIADVRFQAELQKKMEEMQDTITTQAEMAAGSSPGFNYDQQAIIAQADQIAQQAMGLDYGARRSFLDSLSKEDAVMHAVVIQRLEDYQNQAQQQIRLQANQAAGM